MAGLHLPHDPALRSLRRASRVAIVAPLTFAFLLEIVGNSQAALFGAFGSFALLAFADFGGAPGRRVRSYLVLAAAGAALVALGTLLSADAWAAAAVMVLVAFTIRFAGFLGGSLSAAVSPAILAFVLGATVAGPASDIPFRVGGWVLAGVVAAVASVVLWPRGQRRATRVAASRACAAVAAVVDGCAEPAGPSSGARDAAREAITEVRREAAMPTRPAGPVGHDSALSRLVDQLGRAGTLCDDLVPGSAGNVPAAARATASFAASTIRLAGRALDPGDLVPESDVLVAQREAHRDAELLDAVVRIERGDDPAHAVDDLDATFVVRAFGFLAISIAANAAIVVGGHPPHDDDVMIAVEVPREGRGTDRLRALLASHLSLSSPWLQDSVRAGTALGLAVLVALLSSVDHGFWVALGTLSVLRSNAFATGRSAVEAAWGTSLGFALSAVVLSVVGFDRFGLWAVLILCFFLSAYLPQVYGFVAGQAAFTVLVVALFNLLVPEGWRTGLVRVEDILIGVTVSVVVSLLFWPRKAETTLRRSTASLFRALGAAAPDPGPAPRGAVRACEQRAHAAYVAYLDDTAQAPQRRRPWRDVLGIAATARAALEFVVVDRTAVPAVCPEVLSSLDAATGTLGAIWVRVGDAIDGGDPAAPADWEAVAASTREPVVACLAAHARDRGLQSAARAVFLREWLVQLLRLTGPLVERVEAVRR